MKILNFFLFKLAINPLDIAVNAEKEQTIHSAGEDSFLSLFQIDRLYYLLRREAFIIASIVILVSLILMLFVQKSDKTAELKNSIMHKIVFVFLISSSLWIVGAFINVLDFIF